MEEKKIDKPDAEDKKPKNSVEENLPHCTTAASAEHARAYDEDEPCDDGRSGEIAPDHSTNEKTADSG